LAEGRRTGSSSKLEEGRSAFVAVSEASEAAGYTQYRDYLAGKIAEVDGLLAEIHNKNKP
jgi:hypothetical protein